MRKGPLWCREDGVSVIVGTLLLILVAVTAVTGLALMVSQLQKDTMIRESHKADVEGEGLKIQGIELVNSRNEWNLTATNITDSEGNWSTLRFTIVNLNTKDSAVTGIGVKPGNSEAVRFVYNYTSAGTSYDLTRFLTIPAAKGADVEISLVANFSPSQPVFPVKGPLYLHEDDSVTIRVITYLQNVFEATFRPPVPAIKTRIESEDLTVAQRSVLVLDGSDSTDDGNVVAWNWTIFDGSNTIPQPGTWDDTTHLTTNYSEGKVTRLTLSDPGPFRIVLKVTDDTRMTGTSGPVIIPRNPGFNPPMALFVNRTLFPDITVTVRDIGGNPVTGSVVSFIKVTDTFGNLTLTNWSAMTDNNGNVLTTRLDGTGTIRVLSGKLPPVDLAV